jgi:peptidoglycan hydrolase CwlO-like protein
LTNRNQTGYSTNMTSKKETPTTKPTLLEILLKIPENIGTPVSLIIHTIIFVVFLSAPKVFGIPADSVNIFFTTLLSLEAIYLAIFIQMSINQSNVEIQELQEDIEEIQEDVEEIAEDLEEINENVDEIQEDIEEDTVEDEKIVTMAMQNKEQIATNSQELIELKAQFAKILNELEKLNQKL